MMQVDRHLLLQRRVSQVWTHSCSELALGVAILDCTHSREFSAHGHSVQRALTRGSGLHYVGLQAQPVTECIVERLAARIPKGQAHSPFSHLGTKQNKRSSTPSPVRRARRSFFF
jgi:hypothetical protein